MKQKKCFGSNISCLKEKEFSSQFTVSVWHIALNVSRISSLDYTIYYRSVIWKIISMSKIYCGDVSSSNEVQADSNGHGFLTKLIRAILNHCNAAAWLPFAVNASYWKLIYINVKIRQYCLIVAPMKENRRIFVVLLFLGSTPHRGPWPTWTAAELPASMKHSGYFGVASGHIVVLSETLKEGSLVHLT